MISFIEYVIHLLSLAGLIGGIIWLVTNKDWQWEPFTVIAGTLILFLQTEIYALRELKKTARLETEVGSLQNQITESKTEIGALQRQIADNKPTVVIETYPDIAKAFASYSGRISKGELAIKKAELIQHSSQRAYNFIIDLAKANADIDLFLQNPDSAKQLSPEDFVSGIKQRIDGYADPLNRVSYRGRFNLYTYSAPTSLNAVRLESSTDEKILILGWYAYYHQGTVSSLNKCKIGGGENPCVVINSLHENFNYFNLFFQDLLTDYKSQSTSAVVKIADGSIVI